jgi:hypothetical protein
MCIPWQLFLEHQHTQPPRCRKQERSPADYRDFAVPWKTSGKRSQAKTGSREPVGASLPAMDSSAPRSSRSNALSLTTIAGKPAPTRDRARAASKPVKTRQKKPGQMPRLDVWQISWPVTRNVAGSNGSTNSTARDRPSRWRPCRCAPAGFCVRRNASDRARTCWRAQRGIHRWS